MGADRHVLRGDLDWLEFAIADYIAKYGEHLTGHPYDGSIAGIPCAVANMAMGVIRKNLVGSWNEPDIGRPTSEVHKPFDDDGVTYCGWDGRDGCGEVWPCSTVRVGADNDAPTEADTDGNIGRSLPDNGHAETPGSSDQNGSEAP